MYIYTTAKKLAPNQLGYLVGIWLTHNCMQNFLYVVPIGQLNSQLNSPGVIFLAEILSKPIIKSNYPVNSFNLHG